MNSSMLFTEAGNRPTRAMQGKRDNITEISIYKDYSFGVIGNRETSLKLLAYRLTGQRDFKKKDSEIFTFRLSRQLNH